MTQQMTCTRCGETKPLEEFRRDHSRPSGYKKLCKACNLACSLEWYKQNPEKAKAKTKRFYEQRPDYHREKTRRVRMEVLAAYGATCACCGEATPEFLTIDHINDNGAEHRRQLNVKSGVNFYKWLKSQGFPKDNYQLLCFNCNCAKGSFGQCPHDKVRIEAA